jgi:hypothetical protein
MTIGFRLTLNRLSGDRLALTIPLAFRLLLLALGLVLAFALLAIPPGGMRGVFIPANFMPLAICLLSLIGASYRESWTFDREKNTLIALTAVLMIQRRRNWALSELARVEVGQFIRGRPYARTDMKPSMFARPILTLTLHTKEGSIHRLELYSFSQKYRVRQYAQKIASYCGISFLDLTVGSE